jgi:hypothetical protein
MLKELGDVLKSDLVRACGYVSSKKECGERLNFTAELGLKPGDEFEAKLGWNRSMGH